MLWPTSFKILNNKLTYLQVCPVILRLLSCRFYHAFNGYMTHAFPHDELKPLTSTYTDSLGGLDRFLCERLLSHAHEPVRQPPTATLYIVIAALTRVTQHPRCIAGELGNVQGLHSNVAYTGCALTLIDSLSTLAVLGDASNFETSLNWLVQNVSACPPASCQHSVVTRTDAQISFWLMLTLP